MAFLLKSARLSNVYRTPKLPVMLSLRFKHGRENCEEDPFPKCSPARLKLTKCAKRKAKEKIKKFAFKHLIYKPECCNEDCLDSMPRFDDLYYKPSDKSKRKYTRTWDLCPSPRYACKIICNFDNLPSIPYKKRVYKRSAMGKKKDCDFKDIGLMRCKGKTQVGPCPKLTLPGCKANRVPPKCFTGRKLLDCKKICTPYPSFSECEKADPKKKRPVECDCKTGISLCEVFRMMKKGLLKAKQVPGK